MPLKPPISLDELHQIGERNKGNKDVTALLWEIKRYHVLMSRFYQLARSIPGSPEALQLIATAALNEMKDDPAVLEIKRANAELFGQKVEPGDDDE